MTKKTYWQSDKEYVAQRETEYSHVFEASNMSIEEKVIFYMQVDDDKTFNVFHSY